MESVKMITSIAGEEVFVGDCHPARARVLVKKGLASWKDGKILLHVLEVHNKILASAPDAMRGPLDDANVSKLELERRMAWFRSIMTKSARALTLQTPKLPTLEETAEWKAQQDKANQEILAAEAAKYGYDDHENPDPKKYIAPGSQVRVGLYREEDAREGIPDVLCATLPFSSSFWWIDGSGSDLLYWQKEREKPKSVEGTAEYLDAKIEKLEAERVEAERIWNTIQESGLDAMRDEERIRSRYLERTQQDREGRERFMATPQGTKYRRDPEVGWVDDGDPVPYEVKVVATLDQVRHWRVLCGISDQLPITALVSHLGAKD